MKSIKHQQNMMNKLYDDPEFRSKVVKVEEQIRNKKEQFMRNSEIKKQLGKEQDKIIQEMSRLNQIKLKLREEKNSLKNGGKTKKMKREIEVKGEMSALKNRIK